MTLLLRASQLQKQFGTRRVLADISMMVHSHEVVCVLGEVGAGKTTLLRCLNLLEYIDGGVCDPLPVDVLLGKELDHIIAVSVIPAIADLPHDGREPMDSIDAGSRSWWRSCVSWLNRRVNYFARGNLFDILRSAAFGSQLRLAESSGERADVLIRPVTHDCRWHDYTSWRNYIEIGRQAAEAALPEIRALLDSNGAADPSLSRSNGNQHHHPPTARCA